MQDRLWVTLAVIGKLLRFGSFGRCGFMFSAEIESQEAA